MFRPFARFAKKSRLRQHKPQGDFPLHRQKDYSFNPLTVGAPKSSAIRDLDDPTLNENPVPIRRMKPHELFPRQESSASTALPELDPVGKPHVAIPDVEVADAVRKFHWMPHPKSRPKSDEYFAKHFFARDRRGDGNEKELKRLLEEMPDEVKGANKRVSPRKYWYTEDYESPKVEDVPYMKSCEVKKVMMEEAHRVRKESVSFNSELWAALAQRGAEVASGRLLAGQSGPQCGTLSTLRMLQALASVQVPISTSIMQIVERVNNETRLKPQHHFFFLQALARLRLRDARIFSVLEKMSLSWGVLPVKQLVKAANAVAKLDVGSVWVRPLKDALSHQLGNLGIHIQTLKAVAAIELLDEPELYLVEAFRQRRHIRYSRHLQLVEIFVRIKHQEKWEAIGEEVKEWLEEIRDEAQDIVGDEKAANPSTLATSIATAIRRSRQLEWSFEEGQRVGPYFSDIWLFKKKILVEALCPYSFYARTRHITTMARLRIQFLEMMGFQVETIAYYDWPDDLETQLQSLRTRLTYK